MEIAQGIRLALCSESEAMAVNDPRTCVLGEPLECVLARTVILEYPGRKHEAWLATCSGPQRIPGSDWKGTELAIVFPDDCTPYKEAAPIVLGLIDDAKPHKPEPLEDRIEWFGKWIAFEADFYRECYDRVHNNSEVERVLRTFAGLFKKFFAALLGIR